MPVVWCESPAHPIGWEQRAQRPPSFGRQTDVWPYPLHSLGRLLAVWDHGWVGDPAKTTRHIADSKALHHSVLQGAMKCLVDLQKVVSPERDGFAQDQENRQLVLHQRVDVCAWKTSTILGATRCSSLWMCPIESWDSTMYHWTPRYTQKHYVSSCKAAAPFLLLPFPLPAMCWEGFQARGFKKFPVERKHLEQHCFSLVFLVFSYNIHTDI